MQKRKEDYPIVLGVKHVKEIMDVKESAATQYIKMANKKLEQEGYLVNVTRLLRIPRDQFYRIYGITESEGVHG